MRILIIDNNIMQDSWGANDLRKHAIHAEGATIHTRRAPAEDLPKNPASFDRLVISGSMTPATDDAPWISKLETFVRQFMDTGRPVLGVCYGHQLIGRVLGGKQIVRSGTSPEFGWTRIEKVGRSALFDGLADSFYSFSYHQDEVIQLPAGTQLLARSEGCSVQAFQLESKPVFGIQFHPERDLEQGKQALERRLLRKPPQPVLHPPKESQKLFDPKVGGTIFRNFFKL